MEQLRSKDKDIEKYIYLSGLKDADPNMFFELCLNHMPVSNVLRYSLDDLYNARSLGNHSDHLYSYRR